MTSDRALAGRNVVAIGARDRYRSGVRGNREIDACRGGAEPSGGWTVASFSAALASCDGAAWREFLRVATPTARRWCRSLGLPSSESDDVVSDACVRARGRCARGVSPEEAAHGVTAWISSTIHRAAQDRARNRARDVRRRAVAPPDREVGDRARRAEANQVRLRAYSWESLGALTELQRNALMRRCEGLSFATIAARRGVRWESIRELVARAWRRLDQGARRPSAQSPRAPLPTPPRGRIGPREKAILELRDLGMSNRDLAARLGCSVEAVKSAARRIRRRAE